MTNESKTHSRGVPAYILSREDLGAYYPEYAKYGCWSFGECRVRIYLVKQEAGFEAVILYESKSVCTKTGDIVLNLSLAHSLCLVCGNILETAARSSTEPTAT